MRPFLLFFVLLSTGCAGFNRWLNAPLTRAEVAAKTFCTATGQWSPLMCQCVAFRNDPNLYKCVSWRDTLMPRRLQHQDSGTVRFR